MENVDKLGIPTRRRVAGVVLLLLFCVTTLMYLFPPAWFPKEMLATETPHIGIFMLVGTVWCTPTVFYPCLFDRFPKWVLRHPVILRRAAARLGVRLPASLAD